MTNGDFATRAELRQQNLIRMYSQQFGGSVWLAWARQGRSGWRTVARTIYLTSLLIFVAVCEDQGARRKYPHVYWRLEYWRRGGIEAYVGERDVRGW